MTHPDLIITDQECDAATEYAQGRQISRFVRDGDAVVLVFLDGSRLRFRTAEAWDGMRRPAIAIEGASFR